MAELALLGGKPLAEGFGEAVPRWPLLDEEDARAVTEAMRTGPWCRVSGGEGERFERAFAEYHSAKHGVLVANGTVAIELALRSCGVRPGDEVLVPAVTFIASASAVACVGAVPVFVDSDPDTVQIDPRGVEAAITDRTRAVIAVHYGGYPANMDALVPLCRSYGLALVEDCAHAHGSQWRGRGVGSLGSIGCFSFQESKSLTAGEGGIVVTNDDAVAERARLLRNIGRQDRGYGHTLLASNLRMPAILQALMWSAFRRLPGQTTTKERRGRALAEVLRQIGGLDPLPLDSRITRRGYYFMVFRYQPEEFGGLPRGRFIEAVEAEGITGLWIGYGMPLYRNDCFRRENTQMLLPERLGPLPDYDSLHLPVAERFCYEQQVVLSHHVLLASEWTVLRVADAVAKVKAGCRELL